MPKTALVLVVVTMLPAATLAQGPTVADVRQRLQSEFHQGLYARTYRNLVERVTPEGYFEESLTGAYSGMFPRTVGALVSLFLETGELQRAEALVGYVLEAMQANDMERVAHVLGPPAVSQEPVPGTAAILQAEHPTALYRLDQPERFGGAQEFVAPPEPVVAVEAWLAGQDCQGEVVLELATGPQEPALAEARVSGASLRAGGGWVRFQFASPVTLNAQQTYIARARFEGEGIPSWWGTTAASPDAPGRGYGRDTQIRPDWFSTPGVVTAFAVDTGQLQHRERRSIPVYASDDQIDGQAHVILAWARLALRRGPTPFEDRTYETVARLMDRSSDWPYVTPYVPNRPHIALLFLGLVRNVCFEHSREGRFWDCWDLLTQSFVAAALTDMERVARRRADGYHAGLWQQRRQSLEAAIAEHMTRELDGRRVYLEMRLPDGGGGTPFEGLAWVNLSPVAAQWEGVDREILRHTIAAYRQRAGFEWDGKKALALEWSPNQAVPRVVIGKGVGWELAYSVQEGEAGRICEWLDFLAAVNSKPLYMESAWQNAEGVWNLNDPGNGEQCAWWCWGMARVRQWAGLPAAPS